MDYFEWQAQNRRPLPYREVVGPLLEDRADIPETVIEVFEQLQDELAFVIEGLSSQHLNDIRLSLEMELVVPILEMYDFLIAEEEISKDYILRIPDYFLMQPELPLEE